MSEQTDSRRAFLSRFSTIAMAGGVVAAYGTLAGFMGRFMYPARAGARSWLYVTDVAGLKLGDSVKYKTPSGAPVIVARRASTNSVDDFLALSSTCPHLGCRVNWEPQHSRFFCPCHNGVFTPDGKATEGPPAKAGQELLRYPLKIEKGLLYIEVPTAELAMGSECVIDDRDDRVGPGHDPCLASAPRKGDHGQSV
jgi:menaquinol-cytochrome c reductase iron-sulfur subunit